MSTKLIKATEPHPFAALFPLHEGPPLWDLATDIRENGQQEPIARYQGRLLDGRRRELGCIREGIEPWYQDFEGTDAEALAFVVSKNLHRRHLSEAERTLIAAKIATTKKGYNQGNTTNRPIGPLVSQGDAAHLLNVSTTNVKRAARVLNNGTQQVVDAVKDGTLSISDAASIVDQPASVQDAAVAAVKDKEAATASAALEVMQAIKDQLGHDVPKCLEPAFASLKVFEEIDSHVRTIQWLMDETARQPGGEQLARSLQPTKSGDRIIHKSEHLNALKRDLHGTRPHSVCPRCKGAGCDCKTCAGLGWVTKVAWDNIDDATKARLEALHGTQASATRQGKPVVPEKQFDKIFQTHFGPLIRLVDRRGEKIPGKETCIRLLQEFLEAWKEWKLKTT